MNPFTMNPFTDIWRTKAHVCTSADAFITLTFVSLYFVQQVAVKVIHLDTEDASNPLVSSLRHELLIILRAAAACPHVCRYMGVTKKGKDFCIVMQLYKQSLATYITNQPGDINVKHDACNKYRFFDMTHSTNLAGAAILPQSKISRSVQQSISVWLVTDLEIRT